MTLDKSLSINRIGDRVRVKEHYNHLYSPVYTVTFYVAEEHETPFLNGLRLRLGLDSAEHHTTLVHDESFVGSFTDTETRQDDDAGLSSDGLDEMRQKGYEVLSFEEGLEQYDPDDVPRSLGRKMERHEREQRRKRERRERLEEQRQQMIEQGEDVVKCQECAGFMIVDEDAGTGEMVYTYRGLGVVGDRHEMDCDLKQELQRNL